MMKFDEILERHVGECGRYQALLCFTIAFLTGLLSAVTVMDILFTAGIPEGHVCISGGLQENYMTSPGNLSLRTINNAILPHKVAENGNSSVSHLKPEEKWTQKECYMVHLNSTPQPLEQRGITSSMEINQDSSNPVHDVDGKDTCTDWEYDRSTFASTVVTEWDLVCSRSWLVPLGASLTSAGNLVSIFISGFLADRFGRRPVLLGAAVMLLIARVVNALTPSVVLFLVSRFFFGISQVTYGIAYVYVVEFVGPKYRVWISTSLIAFWAIGQEIVVGVAYSIRAWRTLSLVLAVPQVLCVVMYFILPESPRWLISRGRQEEAYAILKQTAHRNGRSKFPVSFDPVDKEKEDTASFKDILKYPVMLKRTIIAAFVWMNISFAYFVLLFNIGSLAGNIYINTAISAAVEIPAYITCHFMMSSPLGRRSSLSGSLLLSAAIMFSTISAIYSSQIVGTILSMLGKFTISFAFMAVYMHTAEVFPTTLRSAAMGICSTMARVGSIVAPFTIILNDTSPLITPIVFGLCTLVSGIVLLLLPETRGRPLPQTVEEAAAMNRKHPNNCDEKNVS